MQRIWLVAFVLLAAPAAAFSIDTPIHFEGPAILEGDLAMEGAKTWGTVGFARDLQGMVELRASQATWTQVHAPAARMTGQVSGSPTLPGTQTAEESLDEVAVDLQASQTWGVMVRGGDATMEADSVRLLGKAGGGSPTPHAPNDWPNPNLRGNPGPDGVQVAGTATVDHVTLTGDFSIELFGLRGDLQSRQGERRLQSGYQQSAPLPAGQGDVDYVVYDVLDVTGATLRLPAHDAHLAFFASSLALQVNGTGHFPLVAGGALPDIGREGSDGTWLVSGAWNLTDVRPSDEAMAGRLHGAPDSLLLDGQEVADVDAATLVAVASIGIGALVVSVAAKFAYGAALFTRMDGEEALQHERRQLLYAYIQENPGATFREVCRETDVPSGTARHHLSVLQRARLVVEHRHRATVRFFENHGKFDDNWNEVVLLRQEGLKQVHAWIQDHPDCIQKDILAAAQGWGWSRSTTQHRLQRLVEEGLVEVRPMGRRNLYTVATATSDRPWQQQMVTT